MRLMLIDYLLNAAWQAPLIALMGMLVCNIAPQSARIRSSMWLGLLWLAVLAPLLPENHISLGLFNSWGSFVWRDPWRLGVAITHGSEKVGAGASPVWIVVGKAAENGLVIAFFAAFMIAAARLAYAMSATVRLLDGAMPVELPSEIACSLGADTHEKPLGFLTCPRLNYPATISLRRPLVLLPATFSSLTPSQQRAVLCHEFEHVRRRDFFSNLLVEFVTLPLCWHPAIAVLKGRVAASREFACDAAAALSMGTDRYAENLVAAIRMFGAGPSGSLERLAPGLRGRSDLVIRVRNLTSRRNGGGGAAGLRLAVSFALAIASMGVIGLAPLLPCAPAAYHAAHYRNGVWRP